MHWDTLTIYFRYPFYCHHNLEDEAIITLLVITFLILVEWMQREKQHALDLSSFNLNRFIRWTIYLIIIFIIINFGVDNGIYLFSVLDSDIIFKK